MQHCTALALIKCLTKFNEVLRIFKSIGDALEEDEVDEYVGGTGSGGRWGRRRWEVEREIRRRVPDVQVIIAFAQQKVGYFSLLFLSKIYDERM